MLQGANAILGISQKMDSFVKVSMTVVEYSINTIPSEDIDECKQRRPCDENATCMDLPGSFHCKCNEGFNGNGFTRNGKCILIAAVF